ncbi:probable flavonol synthase 4 [Cajanus cajan]|uniref:Gibberellin 3-beta-dioxygenase 4 n=1 Tax=Cajanus cajan TaxID=3821 RepID=A0A151SH92_CAJCA|nr:probable flavonol synthase 4 [Cajanus cajan]KYP54149.1 Gibberellin 3-beta-dioxygenase 4 [Cajanus cajan]
MPEITVDFRAPPPSPVASGRRSTVTNDDVLTEFLEASLRVPDLVLPDKIFPKQRHLHAPPEVDFVALCFHRDRALRDVVSDSLAGIGCFQLLNHGIPPQLMEEAAEAAAGVFRVPPARRAAATRSPEKPWGFEEYHAGEEEKEEGSEEFVWCNDDDFKSKMAGIWSTGYPNFSEKMEKVMSRIEMVAMKMLPVILKNGITDTEFVGGNTCCVYKHRRDNSDRWANSLKYDVIRMLIRGTDYSHSLCFHVCNASSQFHLYSKKSWLSFCPHQGALIVTAGDQTQILSGGQYKQVIGRPIFKGDKEESISMAFLYSTQNTNKYNFQTSMGTRTISLAHQLILALILTLVYHLIIFAYKKLH